MQPGLQYAHHPMSSLVPSSTSYPGLPLHTVYPTPYMGSMPLVAPLDTGAKPVVIPPDDVTVDYEVCMKVCCHSLSPGHNQVVCMGL